MKKYTTPTAEKVEFDYKDQVVASGKIEGTLYVIDDTTICKSYENSGT